MQKFIYIALFTLLFTPFMNIHAEMHREIPINRQEITSKSESQKYIWIGTNHGLYLIRKKGNKIYHMTTKNSILPSDSITSIVVSANGEAYIGTHKGILRYDNFAFLLIDNENSALKSNHITSLACLNGNEIYAGTLDKGITVFSGLSSKTYTAEDGYIPNNHVIRIEPMGKESMVAVLKNQQRVMIRNRTFSILE